MNSIQMVPSALLDHILLPILGSRLAVGGAKYLVPPE